MNTAALDPFVDDLMRQKQDPNVNANNWGMVKQLLLHELDKEINLHLVQRLSEGDQIALDRLLDADPRDDELNSFFLRAIPDMEHVVASALLEFRRIYLHRG